MKARRIRQNGAIVLCSILLILTYCSTVVGFTRDAGAFRRRRLPPCFLAPQQLGSFEVLEFLHHQDSRRVSLHDWSSTQTIPFVEAWDYQKSLVDAHLQRLDQDESQFLSSSEKDAGVDTVLFLQHDPVYTLGTGSDPNFIHDSSEEQAVPVVRMDRGGEVTYHGPGQLVVYPILDLRGYRQDIHWYMRALEEAVLSALASAGIEAATREEDVTGVWVHDTKVAAVGIKARRWITLHGLAVNVEESSLQNFGGIVPCGLEGRKVGCVNQYLDTPITVADFSVRMKQALQDVFQVHLVESQDSSFPSMLETESGVGTTKYSM